MVDFSPLAAPVVTALCSRPSPAGGKVPAHAVDGGGAFVFAPGPQ